MNRPMPITMEGPEPIIWTWTDLIWDGLAVVGLISLLAGSFFYWGLTR